MTQACTDDMSGQTHRAAAVYDHHGITFHPCTLDTFSHYFDGLTLEGPGVGPPHRWASTTCLTLSNSISDEDISCWEQLAGKRRCVGELPRAYPHASNGSRKPESDVGPAQTVSSGP
ncbi:hypothetical protein HGA08_12230 [Nocardia vermiculata]|uniref:Uncharacterized protein n=1 Tax=Nocardia vermiculata TaxID=257274 RepID=A0A846XYW0_9NOCA|nr:hypothetical protein [Nocardia vermiculata]